MLGAKGNRFREYPERGVCAIEEEVNTVYGLTDGEIFEFQSDNSQIRKSGNSAAAFTIPACLALLLPEQ
jgi:hypothetical protein